MPADLTFFSGTDTVGGVQVLLRSDTSAVVFDLGVVRNPGIVRGSVLFHEAMPPRSSCELADLLRAGMAPTVEGLYDPALLPDGARATTARLREPGRLLASAPVADLRGREVAVFASHLHEDHTELLRFVDPSVPVLMSDTGARLHRALAHAGTMPTYRATVRPMTEREPYRVGDITVTALPVDHDVPGSSGLLLEVGGCRVAYTGDWRAHGNHPDLMDAFARRCHGVDVLLTEASTAGAPAAANAAQIGEPEIGPWVAGQLADTSGTLYIVLHGRNLERHEAVRRCAVEAGRTMVVSPRMARTWVEAEAAGVRIVDSSAGTAAWDIDDGVTLPGWISRVSPAQVRDEPDRWVAELPTRLRPLLLDVGAGPGDTLVHLNGHPYGPGDTGWMVLQTWTARMGIRLAAASSHGHALPDALAHFVETVRPGLVVPVHTNAPELFPPVTVPVRVLPRGTGLDLHPSEHAA